MKDKNVIITGVNGAIGRYVSEYLCSHGIYVIGLGRSATCKADCAEYWNIDLLDRAEDFLKTDTGRQADALIHLAANVDVSLDDYSIVKDNLQSTYQAMLIAKGLHVKQFIFMSSAGIYDAGSGRHLAEESGLFPKTYYHLSKVLGEELVSYFSHNDYPMAPVILRLSAPVGVGVNQSSFIYAILKKIVAGEEVSLLGKGSRIQNYIDVRDICDIIYGILVKRLSGTYNLGSDKSYSNLEIVNKCCGLFDYDRPIGLYGDDIHEGERWLIDSDKLYSALGGYKIKYDIDDSILWIGSAIQNETLHI